MKSATFALWRRWCYHVTTVWQSTNFVDLFLLQELNFSLLSSEGTYTNYKVMLFYD